MGKPGMAGAHTNQRLSLSKPWEGLRRTCRGFEPDSGNLTVRDYRGASRNVRHGEIVTPSRNRKSGNGNPFTYSGARSNSIPTAKRARKAETPKQPSLYLMLRAPYLYPDQSRTCSATVAFEGSGSVPASAAPRRRVNSRSASGFDPRNVTVCLLRSPAASTPFSNRMRQLCLPRR